MSSKEKLWIETMAPENRADVLKEREFDIKTNHMEIHVLEKSSNQDTRNK